MPPPCTFHGAGSISADTSRGGDQFPCAEALTAASVSGKKTAGIERRMQGPYPLRLGFVHGTLVVFTTAGSAGPARLPPPRSLAGDALHAATHRRIAAKRRGPA